MLSYDELMKKYKKDEEETQTAGPSLPKATTAKKTAGPSAPTGKTTKTAEKSAVSSVSTKKNTPNTSLFQGLNLSKPETKKLSGSDSDVFKRASTLATNTSMSYAEKKKQIEQTQKELGRIRDKHLIASMLGNEDAKKTIQQVTELQNQLSQQLKSTAFGAGFGQAAGLDIYDTAVKKAAEKTGNTSLSQRMAAQDEAREAVKTANEKSYGAGELAGELTQQAILYGTAGAAAEKAALAGVGKLTGGKSLGNAGTFATRMLGQQAADTVVNTPITISTGLAEGKDKEEIAKDVRDQMAMDAAFNLGMGAVGAGAKVLKKVGGNIVESRKARKAAQEAAETAEKAEKNEAVKTLRQQTLDPAQRETATVAETVEAVKGLAAKDEKINEVADVMMQKRNVLAKRMTKEERKALELEYANLKNSEYRAAQLKKVGEETGGDPAAIREASRRFDERMQEIGETLASQEVLRTNDSIRRDVANEIMNIFGLSGKKQKQKVNNSLLQVMEEAKSGEISKKTRDDLFETFFKRGEDSRQGEYGLKNLLQHKKLLVDVEAAADIADITEWNKALKGKLGYTKIGRDSNVEVFYEDLRKKFPAYFPEAIDKPAAQLKRMRKVAEKLSAGIGLDKADYKEDFNRALDRLIDTMNVKSAFSDKTAEKMEGFKSNLLGKVDYGTVTAKDVQSWHNERRRLQAIADKETIMLNKTETQTLEGMLNGDIPDVQAKKILGPRFDLIKQQYDIRKPLKDVQDRIEGYKRYVHAKQYDEVATAVGEIHIGDDGWKDKHPFLYARETQERNLRDIAPNAETANRIEQTVFAPVHENERQRQLMLRDLKDMIRPYKISTKKNLNISLPGVEGKRTSESAVVQWLGEKRFDLQQMKAAGVPEAGYKELETQIRNVEMALQPEQLQRINEGIAAFHDIYKYLHSVINEVLIRNGYDPIGYIEGYFPHMSFDDPTDLMGQAMKNLGFDFTSRELPMDIAGRTEVFKPGKQWSGNFLHREGTQTDYDALRAFDQYIESVSNVIHHTDDIQRLRRYEDYFRYTLSDDGIKAKIDDLRADRSLSIEDRQDKIEKLFKENSQNHKLQNYVNNIRTYTDLLAGKKHKLDRGLETEVLGRSVYQAINTIENKVAANMVGANIGSALTNMIPITQGMATQSLKNNLKGLGEALTYMSKGEADELTKKSAFLTTRKGTDNLYMTGLQKASNLAFKPMEMVDTFSTQAVWRSRYYDNIGKGMAEDAAIREADDFARGLFAGRSKGAMPTAFSSKALKPLTMFQLEVNNQISYLTKDLPKETGKDFRKIMKAYGGIIMGAYIYNDIYEKLTGRRAALDPLGIANEAIGDLTGERVRNSVEILADVIQGEGLQLIEETDKQKPAQMITALTEEVGGNVPFVGGLLFDGGRIPISSALPSGTSILGAIGNMATGEDTAAKGMQTLRKELEKPFWYMAMPFAGGQVKKTLQGLETMKEGGSYNETNNGQELQFAVDQSDPMTWAQSALFGKWATEGGKEYINSGFKDALGTKKTALQKEAQEKFGMSANDYVQLHRELEGKENSRAKLQTLEKAGLSDEAKEFFYQNNILSSDSQKEKYSELRSQGLTFQEASDLQVKISTLDDMYEKKLDTEGFGATKAEQKATELYDYIGKMGVNDATKTALQEEYCKSAIQLEAKYQKVQGILTTDEYATLNDYIGTLKGDGVYLLKSRRVKAAIDTNVTGKSRAEMQKLYEAWDVSTKLW